MGEGDDNIPGGNGIYGGPGAQGVIIRGGSIRGSRMDGIHLLGGGHEIEDVEIEDSGRHGIFVGPPPAVSADLLAELKAAIDAQEKPEAVKERLGPRLLQQGADIARMLSAGKDMAWVYNWLNGGAPGT